MEAILAHVNAGDAEAVKSVASQIILATPAANLDRLIDQPRMAICAIARRLHQHGVSPGMIQPDSAQGAAETDVQTMCRMLTIADLLGKASEQGTSVPRAPLERHDTGQDAVGGSQTVNSDVDRVSKRAKNANIAPGLSAEHAVALASKEPDSLHVPSQLLMLKDGRQLVRKWATGANLSLPGEAYGSFPPPRSDSAALLCMTRTQHDCFRRMAASDKVYTVHVKNFINCYEDILDHILQEAGQRSGIVDPGNRWARELLEKLLHGGLDKMNVVRQVALIMGHSHLVFQGLSSADSQLAALKNKAVLLPNDPAFRNMVVKYLGDLYRLAFPMNGGAFEESLAHGPLNPGNRTF